LASIFPKGVKPHAPAASFAQYGKCHRGFVRD
jgi:hypothetical protein